MIMRKCDRCGAFYENTLKRNRTVLYGKFNSHGVPWQPQKIRYYDVCDECTKSFFEWMFNKEFTDEELKKYSDYDE